MIKRLLIALTAVAALSGGAVAVTSTTADAATGTGCGASIHDWFQIHRYQTKAQVTRILDNRTGYLIGQPVWRTNSDGESYKWAHYAYHVCDYGYPVIGYVYMYRFPDMSQWTVWYKTLPLD